MERENNFLDFLFVCLFEMILFILNRFQTLQSVLPLYPVELLMHIVFQYRHGQIQDNYVLYIIITMLLVHYV